MKILIVDDSMAARMMLKSAIPGDMDCEIDEASNGLEGLNKYKKFRPDITFLDLTMPVMSGFEALEEIKKIDPGAIVIVITADIQKKSVERIMELGALDVVKKIPKTEKIAELIAKAKAKDG